MVENWHYAKRLGAVDKTEISQVEQDEMFSIDKAKRNMIRAAEHIAHDDLNVQKKAHFELARWADIYADLNKVMK